MHLRHQLFRFFHARQENPVLGAVETRESVFYSHKSSVLLESVSWLDRLSDIITGEAPIEHGT